jgi:hypothetical protein
MAGERYEHILLQGWHHAFGYTRPSQGGGEGSGIPERDRAQHAAKLRQDFDVAWDVPEGRQGAYVEFLGKDCFDLPVKSLEDVREGIRLQNVRKEADEQSARDIAMVFVPHDKRDHFLKKIREYETENTPPSEKYPSGNPKHEPLIANISGIRVATLESFWQSGDASSIPGEAPQWVEAWLSTDNGEDIRRFEQLLAQLSIRSAVGILRFPERSAKAIFANRAQLMALVNSSDDIAEFRLAKEIAPFFIGLGNSIQAEHVQALLDRCVFNDGTGVAVCILDTGVNNGHALLQPVLRNGDLHTVNPQWGVNDDDGHGTLMAGTAAYGDMLALLNCPDTVRVRHRLESVKILSPPEDNVKELWGDITAQAISRAEIEEPQRKRIVCMAVTCEEDRDRGRPSAWSAEVDKLAFGTDDDRCRVIIVSAGNVDCSDHWRNYPEDNKTNEVHDPGQAWNALTVGAFTEKTQIRDQAYSGYAPVALSGDLSPFSTTSLDWQQTWPIKPEVVLEGGNVARGPNDGVERVPDLELLSTFHDPQVAQFESFNATSAAAAQAAWLAAQIQSEYPAYWPETVRGLIVHSATWMP